MTEQEFKEQLDNVVTEALNTLDTAVVYGQLSATKQFVEVIYDTNIVNYLNNLKQNTKESA